MKKILPLITLIIIIAIIIIIFLSMSNKKQMTVIHTGNNTFQPIQIIPNHFQDTQCGMTLLAEKHSAQAISPDGKTWFFHDHGGMANWLKDKSFKNDAKIWVMTIDTKQYINARTAWYSRTDNTPMRYGFGAYEVKQDGFITFDEMGLKVLRNETLRNPYIQKELLGK